jgi:hypothetical protein
VEVGADGEGQEMLLGRQATFARGDEQAAALAEAKSGRWVANLLIVG